ncbi:hypothetical protein MYX82_06295 [Acidobacteria bacterium AH-259-D05]|nr:hypothetical protein [Acidobacteria bacterium AH-259-D05]
MGGSAAATQDPFDPVRSKALSGFHVKNRLTVNFTADLPSGDFSGPAAALLAGWQVSGIVTVANGNPTNINVGFDRAQLDLSRPAEQSPNLVPGTDNNPVLSDGNDPRRYWDPSSFELQPAGTLGNLGRNTGIGPGFANVDFSLLKNFSVAEDTNLQFRAEFFNIFNRSNFDNPSRTVFRSSRGRPSGSFGRIRRTATTSREIQLALKFLF